MKTLNKYLIGISAVSVLLTSMSCSKTFYTDKNKNPNAPTSVLPNTLLTPIEVSTAYAQGGDMSRFASMFVQQTAGLSRQSAAYYEYIFTNQDPETLWDNLYTTSMQNDYNMMADVCANGKYNSYKGIAEIMMAYNLQITVDCWGKIPYSQAFQGSSNLSPAYDNDATLYNDAVALCWKGIGDMNNSANDLLTPGSDDVVYGGDLTKWTKFAYAIMARLYIHQASQNGSGSKAMADSATVEVGKSFADNTDNAQVIFGASSTANAPWNQFWNQRGDIYFYNGTQPDGLTYFYDLLRDSLGDPRTTIMIDTVYETNPPYALLSYYQLPTSPVEFICYDELQFILADANLTLGNPAAAQTAYQNGITANMNKFTSANPIFAANAASSGWTDITPAQIAAYILAHGTLPLGVNDAHAKVDVQEYIALYTNPEAWVLWRRSSHIPGYTSTGSPMLSPIAGPFQSNGIPRRLLYPQSEINLNGANVPSATQWSPAIFWDN